MNRKFAYMITLFFYLAIGTVACAVFRTPASSPALPASSIPQEAALSAPTGNQDTAETEDGTEESAALPALPELPSPDPSAASSVQEEPRYAYTASHSSQRLFIRDGASLEAKIIGSLRPGDTGEVVSIGESWVLLKHGDLEGYVFKEYLELQALPQSADPPES